MLIQGIYVAIAASDMAASEGFYTKLFGRGPDSRRMDSLIQWRDVAGANVQVFLNDRNAGASMCTIVVPSIADARKHLAAVGLSLGQEQSGEFGKIAHIKDPAGNNIALAEPPDKTRAPISSCALPDTRASILGAAASPTAAEPHRATTQRKRTLAD